MKFRSLVLLTLASLTLVGASPQLNPLVARRAQPSGVVPPECEEGISAIPLSPRLDIAEVPLPPETRAQAATPPPSATLRQLLRSTQEALQRNDRAAFDASLANVRQILREYPRGGERTQAEELTRIWTDVARVWDAQFEAPFFGEDSPLYATLNAYPGWSEAMRRRVLVDDRERRFFPADESREFLAQLAAARLEGRGTPAPAPTRRVPTKIRADEEEETATALPPVVPRRTTTTAARSTPTRASRPRRTETSSRSSAPAVEKVAPPAVADVPVTTTTTEPPPAPATDTVTTAAPAATATEITGTTATETTATTATTATETTATAVPEQPSRFRSYFLPGLLILVGLGVLVLLFRTRG